MGRVDPGASRLGMSGVPQVVPPETATDAQGNPLLVAVDRDELFSFSVDPTTKRVHTDA